MFEWVAEKQRPHRSEALDTMRDCNLRCIAAPEGDLSPMPKQSGDGTNILN